MLNSDKVCGCQGHEDDKIDNVLKLFDIHLLPESIHKRSLYGLISRDSPLAEAYSRNISKRH